MGRFPATSTSGAVPASLGPGESEPPRASRPTARPENDLVLQSGRKHMKAYQRGMDGAAFSQLVVAVPTALISLLVVGIVFSLVSPLLGVVAAVLWLLSGPLVFQRRVEGAIARHLIGMRHPTPAEAERLGTVWEEVTRRAGVDPATYELWIQERAELNATAAAGHIVGVTRHALDRLPDSRLAAVLAHELGHHVGGHTWAGMLAEWYALPARTAGRWIVLGLTALFRTKKFAGIACGGCLSLFIVQFLLIFAFTESMWWLVLSVAAGPVLITWLNHRAEFRADAYAVGLGFGDELLEVLETEHRAGAAPAGSPQGGQPYFVPPPPPYVPGPAATPRPGLTPDTTRLVTKAAHTKFEARIRQLRHNLADG
ncbi:peptidase [Streptomyces nitrosporeus]|uniref:Peptidase n=1 Tax=Streptomyces nitrosporeus TaxID=28894 RepID=A0A5J6F7X9_9ACTN|nr:peptidase [Streptomyces nitrosporeus]